MKRAYRTNSNLLDSVYTASWKTFFPVLQGITTSWCCNRISWRHWTFFAHLEISIHVSLLQSCLQFNFIPSIPWPFNQTMGLSLYIGIDFALDISPSEQSDQPGTLFKVLSTDSIFLYHYHLRMSQKRAIMLQLSTFGDCLSWRTICQTGLNFVFSQLKLPWDCRYEWRKKVIQQEWEPWIFKPSPQANCASWSL